MIILPGYVIEREVGRGGMANVFLAVQESLSRAVALKVLAPHLMRDSAFVQRFLREGRIAAGLRHRHIVPIFDVGVHDEHAYMALAWLPRGSLGSQALPLPAADALRMLREMAMALGHAHRAGVVHRDVKPENILIDEDDAYVLADFGIAQLANSSQALTAEGSTVGTPAYMAPEQWRGGEIDGRADLYSLGIVFYQCLTGRVPYSGTDGWSVGMQHMQAPLPLLPAPCSAWQPILDRLLGKLSQQRYPDADALLRAIDHLPQLRSIDLASTQFAEIRQPAAALFLTGEREAEDASARLPATVAQLHEELPGAAVAVPATPKKRRRFATAGGLIAVAAAVIGLGWWASTHDRALAALLGGNPTLATVLVLPCESFANVIEHQELGDTLAEVLIHRLSRLRDLTVIARSTTLALQQSTRDPQQLGERSGASHVLSCSIRRSPEGVRIGAELVETVRGTVRWSADFERSSEDLLSIVDELAVGISERLIDQLAGPERARLMRNRATSLEAVAEVEKARVLIALGTSATIAQARSAVETAIRLDPGFAAATVALAQVLAVEGRLQGRDGNWWRRQATPLAEHALALDADSASAHALRATLACADFDWQACRSDIELALSLAPGSADVLALAAQFYLTIGPHERAIELSRRWVRSEPDSPLAWQTLVRAMIHAGHPEQALDMALSVAERFPDSLALWQLRILAAVQLRRCDDARAALAQAQRLASDDGGNDASAASALACAGQREGLLELRRAQDRLLAMGDPVNAMGVAATQLALGEKAAALDTLESMYAARDPQLVAWITQPHFGIEQLAGEPRLLGLLDRLQLPDSALRWQARGP